MNTVAKIDWAWLKKTEPNTIGTITKKGSWDYPYKHLASTDQCVEVILVLKDEKCYRIIKDPTLKTGWTKPDQISASYFFQREVADYRPQRWWRAIMPPTKDFLYNREFIDNQMKIVPVTATKVTLESIIVKTSPDATPMHHIRSNKAKTQFFPTKEEAETAQEQHLKKVETELENALGYLANFR